MLFLRGRHHVLTPNAFPYCARDGHMLRSKSSMRLTPLVPSTISGGSVRSSEEELVNGVCSHLDENRIGTKTPREHAQISGQLQAIETVW